MLAADTTSGFLSNAPMPDVAYVDDDDDDDDAENVDVGAVDTVVAVVATLDMLEIPNVESYGDDDLALSAVAVYVNESSAVLATGGGFAMPLLFLSNGLMRSLVTLLYALVTL